MADQQTELLREIAKELKALRQDQRLALEQIAAAGERLSKMLGRWDRDGVALATTLD